MSRYFSSSCVFFGFVLTRPMAIAPVRVMTAASLKIA